jgi:hypothetical protein
MPMPSGPADECGWDPNQYVVWKNLPKDLILVHFNVEDLKVVLSNRGCSVHAQNRDSVIDYGPSSHRVFRSRFP